MHLQFAHSSGWELIRYGRSFLLVFQLPFYARELQQVNRIMVGP